MRAFAERAGAKVEYLDLPDDMRGLRISSHELTVRFMSKQEGSFIKKY
jgi:hypothetical protein